VADRVEEITIPEIKRTLRQQLQDHGRDQHGEQKPKASRAHLPNQNPKALR